MSSEIRVLGIDLASRKWSDNGSEILSFTAGKPAKWTNIEYGSINIDVGMDAFVWKQTPPHPRPDKGFDGAEYSQDEWKTIFPDGQRQLIHAQEHHAIDSTPTAVA